MTYVVVNEKGPPCPRAALGRWRSEGMIRIRQKLLRKRYYFRRWFYCLHKDCRTTTVMWNEFRVYKKGSDAAFGLRRQLQRRARCGSQS